MKQTVASESEDGKTLEEWDFVLSFVGNGLRLSPVAFRRFCRDHAGESVPWHPVPETWFAVDVMGKGTLMDRPEIPGEVWLEARQFITTRIQFDE
jgi:hypothetical protein